MIIMMHIYLLKELYQWQLYQWNYINFFNQPDKNNLRTYENIRKIASGQGGQGDDYTTGYLLDYSYFNNYYKIIAIDLSK